MKKFILSIVLVLSMVLIPIKAVNAETANQNQVDIIFTSDIHSNILSYEEEIDGKITNVGGFQRLKTFIDGVKSNNPEPLIVDAGDIVIGTLSQAVIDTEAIELSLLSEFGYDAYTSGNHDFDCGVEPLADMHEVVTSRYVNHTAYVNCNIDFTQTDDYTKRFKEALDSYGRSEYIVVNKNGVKIAVTGVIGYDAIECAPTCELTFNDPIESVKETVAKIKANENPDMIVVLSHSGEDDTLGIHEDTTLAKAVPDIDVIISGHTHTLAKEEILVGNTHIVCPGSYLQYAGHVQMTKKADGRWLLDTYEVKLLDESVEDNVEVLNTLDNYIKKIDEETLKDNNLVASEVVAINNGIDFESVAEVHDLHVETKLGNILSDAYRYAANSTPTGQEDPIVGAVVPAGTIRSTLLPGEIVNNEAFNILCLGIGDDGKAGYPLVSFYLTGKEIATVAELDATVSDFYKYARLYTSGVCFSFNPHRMILNKINDIWICSPILEESRTEIEPDKLYRVVTDRYSMEMFGTVTDLSKGLLSCQPKDKNGNPVTDMDQAVIYDNDGNELKAWVALSRYLQSFPKNEYGISVIPEYYDTFHNRKVNENTWNPVSLFKNSNKFFYIFNGIIILLIVLVVVIIRAVRKSIHKKKVFIDKR